MHDTMVIHAQCKEWHGDEFYTTGRYKDKGNRDFLITLNTIHTNYNRDEVRAAFNDMYDEEGIAIRYEYIYMEPYIEPQQIKDIGCMYNLINKHIEANGTTVQVLPSKPLSK